MTRYLALLRGVNLGKRTVKSVDLKAAFEGLGFAQVKTLLASGNVLFDAAPTTELKTQIEAGLRAAFGFDIGVVLRERDELAAMVAADPFGGRTESEAAKLHVMLFDEALPTGLTVTGIAGDYDIAQKTDHEIFIVAHRKPDGTYVAGGMLLLEKQLPKGRLVTSRNWNTILKALA
jgi:uncharacterized protein (DUF1697 family)